MHLSAGENKSFVLSPVHTHSPFICIHNSGRVKQCSKLRISSEVKGYSFPEHLCTCGPGGHIDINYSVRYSRAASNSFWISTSPHIRQEVGPGPQCVPSPWLLLLSPRHSLTVNPCDSVSFSFQAQWNNSSLWWGVRALACDY